IRHTSHNLVRHAHPQVILHELGVAQARQRSDTLDPGNPEAFDPTQKLLEHAHVEYRLSDRKLRARLNLVSEAANLLVDVRNSRIRSNRNCETRGLADRVLAD